MGTVETIAQTASKKKSEVKAFQAQPIGSNIVSTGALSVDEERHLGVAVPVTMEEIEKELATQSSVRGSSTSKDGISTWILLSGTNPTAAPEIFRSSDEIQKFDKISKIRDNSKAPNKVAVKSSGNTKNKPKPKTTTPIPSVTNGTNSVLNTGKVEILPDPVPLAQTPILKSKKRPPNTVATTPQTPEEVTVTDILDESMIVTTKETPVPFLVLEPKDADFDLPQDRSPGKTTTKKPKRNNNKTKKKNNKKPNNNNHLNDTKNSTKTAIKKKENPIGTKIYNYLSREMMPAVGLLGLVLTAGLAGYFVGPFGALRRSYDVADRKDDLYYFNNEEYAGTDGQYEEEVFGKVIAGMPVNTNHRNNVRHNNQRPNYYHQNQGPSKYTQPHQYNNRYRNAQNQPIQQQQHPAHQLSYSGYHPNTQNHAANYQRIHHVAPASQNVVSQKSISSPIFAIQPSSPSTTTTLPATVVHDINNIHKLTSTNVDTALQTADIMEDSPNELKKRTQFVVGSVLPETNVMDMNNDRDKTVVVPEHGPRRRRSVAASSRKGAETDVKNLENSYDQLKKRVDSTEKNEQILKEMKHIDYEIGRLRKVIAEIKDIEQFHEELHINGKNGYLSDTIANGVIHITEDIKFVNELLDNPIEIDSKILNREAMMRTVNGEKPLNVTVQKKSDVMNDTYEPTEPPSGIMSLLKILELKAAFGVNVLRSIRPAFDRAFADVFHAPTHQELEST